MDTTIHREPLLVGTTGDTYQHQTDAPSQSNPGSSREQHYNYFKSAQWSLTQETPCPATIKLTSSSSRSPDGTTILTSTADNHLRSFILPSDLLSPPHPHTLEPYSTHPSPEPVYASVFHPLYTLQDPSTCLILSSLRSLPLRLFSPFAPNILASYPLIKTTTEAYITPHSLLFSTENTTHFFAGSDSCLYIFDINRNGQGPLSTMRTTPSRRNHSSSNQGMKGIISAMAMSNEGVLAAGTFNRWVSLYDSNGRGETIATFPLATPNEEDSTKGQGITQVRWSSCSRYLCIAERCSDGISVWDIRGTGKQLAWLAGRQARTQQRLQVDILGDEVWAGGTDGSVRVWDGLGMSEGVVESKWGFHAHEDVVSSALLHPTGSLLATCSGQRHWRLDSKVDNSDIVEIESDAESDMSSTSSATSESSANSIGPNHKTQTIDNSLKLWAL